VGPLRGSQILPLGTKVRVTKLSNGRSIVVRINDPRAFIRDASSICRVSPPRTWASSRAAWRRWRSKCSAFPSASGVERPSEN